MLSQNPSSMLSFSKIKSLYMFTAPPPPTFQGVSPESAVHGRRPVAPIDDQNLDGRAEQEQARGSACSTLCRQGCFSGRCVKEFLT